MEFKSAAFVALAATVSTGVAAQSNLTVYGRVDGGLQYTSYAHINGQSQDSKLALVSGFTNGNRVGIKGSESLGGGLKAIYVLEGGFDLDTGEMRSDRLFSREALLGLSGRAGTAAFGRFGGLSSGTGSFNMNSFDPFGTSFGPAAMKTSFVSKRLDNAVAYETAAINGAKFAAMYSFETNGQELADANLNERYKGIGASFRRGGLRVATTYEVLDLKNSDGRPDAKSLQLGGSYDLGSIRAYFNYERANDAPARGISRSAADANFYLLGARVDLPKVNGQILASYQLRDGKSFLLSNKRYESDFQVFSIGYLHSFSKRTQLYGAFTAAVGDKSLDKNAGSGSYAAASASNLASNNSRTLTMGMRTRF